MKGECINVGKIHKTGGGIAFNSWKCMISSYIFIRSCLDG